MDRPDSPSPVVYDNAFSDIEEDNNDVTSLEDGDIVESVPRSSTEAPVLSESLQQTIQRRQALRVSAGEKTGLVGKDTNDIDVSESLNQPHDSGKRGKSSGREVDRELDSNVDRLGHPVDSLGRPGTESNNSESGRVMREVLPAGVMMSPEGGFTGRLYMRISVVGKSDDSLDEYDESSTDIGGLEKLHGYHHKPENVPHKGKPGIHQNQRNKKQNKNNDSQTNAFPGKKGQNSGSGAEIKRHWSAEGQPSSSQRPNNDTISSQCVIHVSVTSGTPSRHVDRHDRVSKWDQENVRGESTSDDTSGTYSCPSTDNTSSSFEADTNEHPAHQYVYTSRRGQFEQNAKPINHPKAKGNEKPVQHDQMHEQWRDEGWKLDKIEFVFPEVDPLMVNGPMNIGQNQDKKQKRVRLPRMFHKRSGKDLDDASALSDVTANTMASSPIAQLTNLAKEMNLDLASLIEYSDNMTGGGLYLPCVQCYGKGRLDRPPGKAGICPTCGIKAMTLGTYGKMICQMRDLIKEKDLVAHDVYNDGNCQFSAIVDQLRVRGNFRYTVRTLRRSAVQFLRENPMADKDTHLEQFLDNETWESYLDRISEDGQWGDHMVLNAICNVINMRIVVYGGMTGQTETVLLPLTAQTPDKETPANETSNKDIPNKETPDKETSNKETSNKETDKDEGDDNAPSELGVPTIYLGHLGESHYISLRPRDWKTRLLTGVSHVLLEDSTLSQQKLTVNVFHIDNVVRKLIQLGYISTSTRNMNFPNSEHGKGQFHSERVGHIASSICPRIETIESFMPSIDSLFPTESSRKTEPLRVMTMFVSPKDTYIQVDRSNASAQDLIIRKDEEESSDIFRLIPIKPKLWKGQVVRSVGGEAYLKGGINTCVTIPKDHISVTFYEIIAFQCDWPDCAIEWLRRKRASDVLTDNDIHYIWSNGCHVIPVSDLESFKDVMDYHVTSEMAEDGKYWCYSFAQAERDICIDILTSHQRRTFRLFKYLVEAQTEKCALPSSVMKSVFYYASESIPTDDWKSQPGQCILIMLNKLRTGLVKQRIPHYFIASVNLLARVPRDVTDDCAKGVGQLYQNFLLHLYLMMDATNITCSEVGLFFDDILEDIVPYSSHRNILQSFTEAVIPSCSSLVQSLFTQKEFYYTLVVTEDLKEQMSLYTGNNMSYAEVLRTTMRDMVLGQQYCVALFIDIMRNTNVTEEICAGYPTVPLTAVLGPDLPDCIKNKNVISQYAIAGGQLQFIAHVTCILRQCYFPNEDVAKVLRFYLDSYSELAGENVVMESCGCATHKTCHRGHDLMALYLLYENLFRMYDKLGTTSEYRSLMPTFSLLCNHFGQPYHYQWLKYAWECLGEDKLAREAERQVKYENSGSSLISAIMQTMR